MPNTLLTISMITREAMVILENNTVFTKMASREYDDKFAQTGAKIGTVLNVRLPVQSTYTTGQGIQIQDQTETSVPIAITTQYQRAFVFSNADLTLNIDDFSRRFLKPHLASMANQIDQDGLALYKRVYQVVGTPGATPTALDTYLDAGVKLDNAAAPLDERSLVISSRMQASIVAKLAGLLNPAETISEQYETGTMGRAVGYKWNMDQNVNLHTIGAWAGSTPTVTTAPTLASTTIVTGGWAVTTAVLNQGDVITFAGCNSVNPQSKQDNNELKQFVVTANCTSGGGGALTIPVDPPFIASGPLQNVTAYPAANAVITVFGASGQATSQGLAFTPGAFVFATADIERAGMGDMDDRITHNGISMRVVRVYDINLDRKPCRIDVLGGWAIPRPQLACRISS